MCSARKLLARVEQLEETYLRMWQPAVVDERIQLYLHVLQLCTSDGYDSEDSLSVGPPSPTAGQCPGQGSDCRSCIVEIYPLGMIYNCQCSFESLSFSPAQELLSRPGVSLDLSVGRPVQVMSELLGFDDDPFGSLAETTTSTTHAHQDKSTVHLCCVRMARAYHDRFQHSDDIDDIEAQLALSTYALTLHGLQPLSHAESLLHIGSALHTRYACSENLKDLDNAELALRQALRMNNQEDGDPIWFLLELGACLHKRFLKLGNMDELTESIDCLQKALGLVPDTHLLCYRITSSLASCLASRYTNAGALSDLEKYRRLQAEVLSLCPPGHRDRYKALYGLGHAYWTAFQKSGIAEDLDSAIQYQCDALDICPSTRTARGAILIGICNLLRFRFVGRGEQQDLDLAVDMGREALQYEPKSGAVLTNLSVAIYSRFRKDGRTEDLEECIQLGRRTLVVCQPGHPRRDVPLNNVAKMLMLRFEQSFDLNDLEEAVVLLREALSLRAMSHPEWGPTLFNYAEALKLRYLHSQNLPDLEEAVSLHELWLEKRPEDMVWREYLYLDAIAELRRLRFELLGDVQDLHEAIDIQENACRIRPDGHSAQNLALASLATTYRMRAELLGTEPDLRRAMELHAGAAARVQSGQRDRAPILLGLSRLHLVAPLPARNITNALDLYCDAIKDSHCSASIRLAEGLQVLQMFKRRVVRGLLDSEVQCRLFHAYQLTVHLLPQVAYFGLDVRSRFRLLARAPTLAADAAVHALRMSDAQAAVEILEEGRAVFWVQYLRLRSCFDELPDELAEQLAATSRMLESGSVQCPAPPRIDHKELAAYEEQLAQRRRVSEKFDALVLQARSIPGFSRFMLNDMFASLSLAAQSAPVLILLSTSDFCGALLLRDPTSGAEQLRFGTSIHAEQLVKANKSLHVVVRGAQGTIGSRAMRRASVESDGSKTVLEELWDSVVRVVVKALGWKRREGRSRPRLLICPTGLFTHLPIHAAGIEGETCADYFVTSYTPTLGVLLAARRRYKPIRRSDARVLLAAVPRPFKWSRLPSAVVEIERIKRVLPSPLVTCVPTRPSVALGMRGSASCADVLSKLPDVTVLHLACHGHHDAGNALDSGFLMRDRILTVTELMELNLPHAFFAFLSACETAKAAEDQPDQAIHLAATMLFAGFKSVIGTMWSMGDVDGPAVATRVYEELFSDESEYLDADSVPYALDAAIGELRRQNLHPSRWAPYIHLGI